MRTCYLQRQRSPPAHVLAEARIEIESVGAVMVGGVVVSRAAPAAPVVVGSRIANGVVDGREERVDCSANSGCHGSRSRFKEEEAGWIWREVWIYLEGWQIKLFPPWESLRIP